MVTLELFDSGAAQDRRDCSDAALSPADEAAIARYGRDAGEPFLRAMRLLPSSRRRAMEALFVFRRELVDIAQGQASRTLKLALLADWRAEIARLYARQPQRLATPALRYAIERSDLRCDDFLAIIAGTEMEVRSDVRAPVFAELDLYCERSAVTVCRIVFQILGVTPPASEPVAAALGRGMQLASILRDLTQDAAQQRLYLPREILRAHGIIATMPTYVLAQPALHRVCDDIADLAAAYFVDAERALPASPRWVALGAKAMLASYRALLAGLRARGWTRLDAPVHCPVWSRPALRIGDTLLLR
jgi:phytoene synthase